MLWVARLSNDKEDFNLNKKQNRFWVIHVNAENYSWAVNENNYILIALYSQLLIIYANRIEMVVTNIRCICISVCVSVLVLTWIYLGILS